MDHPVFSWTTEELDEQLDRLLSECRCTIDRLMAEGCPTARGGVCPSPVSTSTR